MSELRLRRDRLRAELERLTERIQLLRRRLMEEEPLEVAWSHSLAEQEEAVDQSRAVIEMLLPEYKRLAAEEHRLRRLLEKHR
jgi:uncharacterized coiled-coil protein SlyX